MVSEVEQCYNVSDVANINWSEVEQCYNVSDVANVNWCQRWNNVTMCQM